MVTKEKFIKMLCEEDPLMKEDLLDEDYEGLFSLQVGVFRNYTQESIDRNDFQQVDEYIAFIDKNYNEFDHDVENAIVISYLEKIDFKNYPISKKYKEIQRALKEYSESAYNDQKLITHLKEMKG